MAQHEFLQTLAERPLLFDGAIGTELYRRGIYLTANFEELVLSRPNLVVQVHRDYLRAGAQVITTNSYGANRIRLERFGLHGVTADINRSAAKLAQEAAGRRAWVAGSVGPSGLEPASYMGPSGEKRLRAAFAEQMGALAEGGASLLLLETFAWLGEMKVALEVAAEAAPGLPVLATMRFEPGGELADGSGPEHVAEALVAWGADVIGANCGEGPGLVFDVGQRMLGHGRPVLCQPNAGSPEVLEGRTIYAGNPEFFGVYGRRMLKAGIGLVGGCCGTTPEHIARMRGAVRMMGGVDLDRGPGVAGEVSVVEGERPCDRPGRVPVEQRSALAQMLAAGEFVVSVEVNPPAGLDMSTELEACRMLRDAGATVINVADGPRASARMTNLVFAERVERDAGLEALLHVCCRDRNLLALQADLLGAHELGLRNLVVITGDPPKVGDYPDATAVYDLDSIGLLKLVGDLNRGLDPAGKQLGEPTRFHVATGAEPAATDRARELMRLERKIAAGADFVMTQPVYDPAVLERFLREIEGFRVPVLVGLLPLASARNADFLHRNVPGMQVPDAIRGRMAAAGSGERARAEGVAISREALDAVRDRVQGAYIMPPLGHYHMAAEILASA